MAVPEAEMFPKVFAAYWQSRKLYGDVSRIPTKHFFFGMEPGEETVIEMAPGKRLGPGKIRLLELVEKTGSISDTYAVSFRGPEAFQATYNYGSTIIVSCPRS